VQDRMAREDQACRAAEQRAARAEVALQAMLDKDAGRG